MNRVKLVYHIARYLGPGFIRVRSGLYLRRRLGITGRLFRTRQWDAMSLDEMFLSTAPTVAGPYAEWKRDHPPAFLFPLGQPPRIPDAIRHYKTDRIPSLRRRHELLTDDRCVYFFHRESPERIDWHYNPFERRRSTRNVPWYDLPDYLPEQGDPRTLWEPSRAAWAIDCAKVRSANTDSNIAAIFWRWVDSWMMASPPFVGFQWKCGQESAVRSIALLLGFWSVAMDEPTTPERFVQIAKLAWATAYRIQHHMQYAVSQKNNHALSEACGLLLIGQLFPEFRRSASWQKQGRRVLAREIKRQSYADGSYVQHSMNYQRVMLQVSILALRLAELAGTPFPRDVYDCVARAGDFLFAMMDRDTGRLPLYGHNDGAYVLPLSECDFQDFRPVVQAAGYLTHRQRRLPGGPWDEDLVWLFGPNAVSQPRSEDSLQGSRTASRAFTAGGYYTLRRPDSWAMIRCHRYKDRPGQYDQLHVDLWWRGQNVLRDCGTFQYYCPGRPDVEYYFKSIRSHNTVEIDGHDPLELVSRFLWFPWPRGETRRYQAMASGTSWVETTSYDYQRAPARCLHRRTLISLPGDVWVVVDDLIGTGRHRAVLRWHLLDSPLEPGDESQSLLLDTRAGTFGIAISGTPSRCQRFDVIRGRDEPENVQGFAAPYYGERRAIPTIEAEWHGRWPLRLVSSFSPGRAIVPRCEAPHGEIQRWTVGSGEVCHVVELASPSRGSGPVLLRSDNQHADGRVPPARPVNPRHEAATRID